MRTDWNAIPSDASAAAGMRLHIDMVTAEVVGAFSAAAVPSVVLKGPSIAAWLYPEGTRTYVDSDILVPATSVQGAETALRSLGFRPGQWGWQNVSRAWIRGLEQVDLHTSLFSIEAPAEQVWAELSSHTSMMRVGNLDVAVMARPALAFHIALHSAQHGSLGPESLEDLKRALVTADRACWREAVLVAGRLAAVPALATGLCLLPEGRAMAEDLGIAGERSMLTALHAGGAKPLVLGIEHIAAAPNNRARARFIAKKVFPSPAALRKESALARRGAAGLALAYVWRPASRVVRLPGAIAAWRAARRLRSADR